MTIRSDEHGYFNSEIQASRHNSRPTDTYHQEDFDVFLRRVCRFCSSFFVNAALGTFRTVRNAQSSRSIGVFPCGSGIGSFVLTIRPPTIYSIQFSFRNHHTGSEDSSRFHTSAVWEEAGLLSRRTPPNGPARGPSRTKWPISQRHWRLRHNQIWPIPMEVPCRTRSVTEYISR
jgi:hypothetical protein